MKFHPWNKEDVTRLRILLADDMSSTVRKMKAPRKEDEGSQEARWLPSNSVSQ